MFSKYFSQCLLAVLPLSTMALASEIHILERKDGHLFKGEKIPDIDWHSSDTYNFTWGLTGVNNFENLRFSGNLWATCAVMVAVVLAYRMYISQQHYVRLISTIASDRSANYFSQPLSGWMLFLQKHLLIAPMFRHRHNEPFTMSFLKLHWGTLPSRINGLLLFGYVLSNVLYCTLLLPWNGDIGPDGKYSAPTKAALVAEFRGRTGVMATVNMIPLFVCILRNNYLGNAMGVGFNTWNLYHRWIGRIVFLESYAHMGAWMLNKLDQSDWNDMWKTIGESAFLQVGLIAEIALFFIVLLSVAPMRHNHYQIFLGSHQISILFFLIAVWLHCHVDQLPQKLYVSVAIGIWFFERAHRVFTICTKNVSTGFGKGLTISMAKVKLVPAGEDAVHLTVTMKNGWEYKPGTHAYIYIPRLSWTQSHPFSIAWSSSEESKILMKNLGRESTYKPHDNQGVSLAHRGLQTGGPNESTDIHFIIGKKNGFTGRLFESALRASFSADAEKTGEPAHKQYLAFVEGPYTNESHSFDSFASVLFIVGGSGITHPLGYIRHLLTASSQNLSATKRIKLAWIVRDMRNVTWISEWLSELWRLDAGRDMLEVEIYVTRPLGTDHSDGSSKVKWFAGRPQADVLVASMLNPNKATGAIGAVAVNVCGPGALADNIRAACRKRMATARIEFSEESFTWS